MARVIYNDVDEVYRAVVARLVLTGANAGDIRTIKYGPYSTVAAAKTQLTRERRIGVSWGISFLDYYIEKSTTTWERVG
jgi:hypothetical protein